MSSELNDETIEEIHRIRAEISAKFGGDLYAITADARARMEASGQPTVDRAAALPSISREQKNKT